MSASHAFITGIGQSEVGVRLERHPLLLTLDATREALTEAGLSIEQIDGVSTYPGRSAGMLGFSPVGADELIDALGIKARWHAGGMELTSQFGAITAAAMAVRTGQARHVLCYRTVYEAAAMARPEEYPIPKRDRVDGYSQWFALWGNLGGHLDSAIRHAPRKKIWTDSRTACTDCTDGSQARDAKSACAKPIAPDYG